MNLIADSFMSHIADLLPFWLIMQLQTGAFILIILGIDSLLQNASPRVRYLLWMTALVKAFIPPVLAFPTSGVTTAVEGATFPAITVGALALQDATGISTAVLLASLLLLAAVLLGTVVFFRTMVLHHRMKNAQPFRHDAWEEGPPVFVADGLPSPLAYGFLRPRICITPEIAGGARAMLHAVLHHERAHLERKDQVTVFFQTLIQIISVINPLVWLMNTRLFRYREQICDATALQRTQARPQDYGRLLLNFAERHPARLVQVGTCFFETRRGYVQRINQLFTRKEAGMTPWAHRMAIAVCVLLVAPLSWKCSDDPKSSVYWIHSSESYETEIADSTGKEEGSLKLGDPVFSKVTYEKIGKLETGHGPELVGGLKALSGRIIYPEKAREEGIEGTVVVQATIRRDGPPDYVNVICSVNPVLDKAAEEAVQSAAFKAARRNGIIQEGDISIPIRFRLK
ncbi:MAG: M56 family metallopeptidase [Bacteroidetes bacterium]|nr:M56 family metallopeptidase [Bacteroidota bacterium]